MEPFMFPIQKRSLAIMRRLRLHTNGASETAILPPVLRQRTPTRLPVDIGYPAWRQLGEIVLLRHFLTPGL